MTLYGIVRRKLGKKKLKVCTVDNITGQTTTESLSVAEAQLSHLTLYHSDIYEYVLVTFTGDNPL